jgi:hypothetical protein
MSRHNLRNRYPVATWAMRKQDLLLVSAFGAWAAILGLMPVFAFRALLP